MASKIFLDANILLDITLKREAYNESKQVFLLASSGRVLAYITPSILHITGYWLTKAYGASKAKELLLTILTDVTVIDMPHEIALTALHSSINDIEDALQYYTAIHHKLDVFVSRDKQLQKNAVPALPVYTPIELIKEFI
ncbi:MAG: PIN domain-containing protein [Pedobacter sp.]|nr:MAG: PIN domain-containing protein [Pedobacter sp.]